ncbi:ATP-binding cassette domain-containing protein [Sphingobacterium kyonggiense]
MLKLHTVSYGYTKKRQILRDITLDLHPGKIFGLLGLNGEGKTTLIKLMEGMLLPQSGTIEYAGIPSKERAAAYHDQVFFLPDETKLPAMDLLDFGKTYGSFYSKFNFEEYQEYLEAFNIPQPNKLDSLSLGQRRKVHISFALACNTAVLLMDEPSNGLDIPSKSIFRKLIAKAMTDDKSFVISSHQIRDIDLLLEHLLILKDGHLLIDDSIENLSKNYQITNSIQENDEVIYQMDELNGSTYLIKNKNMVENRFDIEFFFTAINQSKQHIKS